MYTCHTHTKIIYSQQNIQPLLFSLDLKFLTRFTLKLFINFFYFDAFQECIFDKTNRDVRLTKLTIWDRILSTFSNRSTGVG